MYFDGAANCFGYGISGLLISLCCDHIRERFVWPSLIVIQPRTTLLSIRHAFLD